MHASHASSSRLLARIVIALGAVSALAVGSGCAPAPAPPPASPPTSWAEASIVVMSTTPARSSPPATTLSPEVRSLILAFASSDEAGGGSIASRSVLDQLRGTGFAVEPARSNGVDGRIEVALDRSDPESPRIGLTLRRSDAVVEALVSPLRPGDEETAAHDLATRLASSPRLAAFAAAVRSDREQHQAASQGRIAPAGPPVADAETDESAWHEAAERRCRNPRSADACDELERYVRRFPQGRYAERARAIVDLSAHRIEQLRQRPATSP